MDVAFGRHVSASPGNHTDQIPTAINSTYFAFADERAIRVSRLDKRGDDTDTVINLPCVHTTGRAVLAFSHCNSNRLAVSTGSEIAIYDVISQALLWTIHGVGRAVTSAAWSHDSQDLLAIGHLDGRVVIWDPEEPRNIRHVLSLGKTVCHRLSWSRAERCMLAASSQNEIQIWEIGADIRRFPGQRRTAQNAEHLLWSSHQDLDLLAISLAGKLSRWNFQGTSSITESNEIDSLFGDLEGINAEAEPVAEHDLRSEVRSALLLGRCHIAILDCSAVGRIKVFDICSYHANLAPLWQASVNVAAKCLSFLRTEGLSVIQTAGCNGTQDVELPASVLAMLDLSGPVTTSIPPVADVARPNDRGNQTGGIKPVTIAMMKAERANFSKTSMQLQSRRPRSVTSPSARPMTGVSELSTVTTMLAASPQASMTSSLELPKTSEAEDSPMPFLSPSIPARKPSPMTLPPIDDVLCLPPPSDRPPMLSNDVGGQDSDSDDETFNGNGMQGSGVLIPGGTNVPLPRSCGGTFGVGGQLVTFLPRKPRPVPSENAPGTLAEPKSHFDKAAILFTTFGNLTSDSFSVAEDAFDSGSDEGDSWSAAEVPDVSFQPPSFQSMESWKDRTGTAMPAFMSDLGQKAVNIAVREYGGPEFASQVTAVQYEVPCGEDENESELCHSNAIIAQANGLQDVAAVWVQAARLIKEYYEYECKDPTFVSEQGSVVDLSGLDSIRSRTPLPELCKNGHHRTGVGTPWVVEQIFAWAEIQRDIEVLACLSAAFLSASRKMFNQQSELISKQAQIPPRRPQVHQSASYVSATDYKGSRPIPILRNDSQNASKFHESPAKSASNSGAASRNPSQPTTPYLDSLSSTPPYLFPNLSRQGSHLSTSGSASPEYSRSSFSAAAKYYAQSITDKFSSYGTSPPVKRLTMSTSPGNELSSSLPMAGGSWTKSVSFASKTDTVGHDRYSKVNTLLEDGNDSENTIEDLSQAQTPRSDSGLIVLTQKGKGTNELNSDDKSARYCSMLPDPLLSKARIWIHCYSEQQRFKGKFIEAAELENLAANLHPSSEVDLVTSGSDGVFPDPAEGQRKTICGICECRIDGLQHFCPSCCHTSHVSCLQSFVESCDVGDFECPTGCGCDCSLLPYDEVSWEGESPMQDQAIRATRNSSFADTRRWHAGVEEDSS